ncbi:histidine phosphatase family protein [Bacillus songklensis]|uniref:Histidine phosphatase family protein n=1 Tax=Bacillus songklensis TaxID=1069116 RepID=A0ABV8AXG2_9BACI
MEISFIRHGPSCCKSHQKCNVTQFKKWIQNYDQMGMFKDTVVSLDTIRKCREAALMITSPPVRTVQSARTILPGMEKKMMESNMFREAELPIFEHIPSFIRLKPHTWAFFFRLLWMVLYKGKVETYRQAVRRAQKASEILSEYARIHGKVVFVGHGIFNRMVAKELKKQGWKGEYPPCRHHFYCTTYVQGERGSDEYVPPSLNRQR